ncbi:MAG: U32 family peptidase [Eubacterium sp.]|nr:U32 family peptidase [Eubacterium sp.]
MKNPEILAPAGSLDTIYAAIAMGADAVYVGAPRFGARAFAENPTVEQLTQAIADCHRHGKRLYLTTNTLLTDQELDEDLLPMMEPLVEAGLDAAIVQDPGVLIRLHEAFPYLPLHASTQMALFSGEEAELLRRYGVTRFVPARELTIEEIRTARAQTDLEIEVFVHGALCVCYSGWCLMSEHIGGRSGNRGMCAGPCRLPYTRGGGQPLYELNAKDSETLLHIPEMIEAGIDSFKIEGRMKSKEYASYIAYLYRHYADIYLDEGADYYRTLVEDTDSQLWKDRKRAMDIYNRGGFFPSYLFAKGDEPTIEPRVKGHFGLPVGRVESVNRSRQVKDSTATIALTEELQAGDVLAIRDNAGETVYEFTVGQPAEVGMTRTTPIGFSKVTEGDIVVRTKNTWFLTGVGRMIEGETEENRTPLRGNWIGKVGQAVQLSVEGDLFIPAQVRGDRRPEVIDYVRKTIAVTVTGDIVQQASNRPVTADDVGERLVQLGGTDYRWENLQAEMEEGAFIPLKAIKELRREAIRAFEEKVSEAWKIASGLVEMPVELAETAELTEVVPELQEETSRKPAEEIYDTSAFENEESRLKDYRTWIRVFTMEQLESVLTFLNYVSRRKTVLHVKLGGFSASSLGKIHTMWKESEHNRSDIVWAFSLPRAWRGKERSLRESEILDFFSCFTENDDRKPIFVVNSMASLVFCKKHCPSFVRVADENMYIWNGLAERFYAEKGVHRGPSRTYGHIPVMTSAHPIREGEIETPKGDRFVVVKPEGAQYRVIVTADPIENISSGHEPSSKKESKSKKQSVCIDFSIEQSEEVREVLEKWL